MCDVMAIVLTVFVKGYEEREMETKELLMHLCNKCYTPKITTAQPQDVGAYPQFVKENWGVDDLILLEHDIVPTIQQLDEIRNCKYDVCNYSYYIPTSNGDNHTYGLLSNGLGLAKFSLNFQKQHNVNEVFNTNTFINIDIKVNEYLQKHNIAWHSHGIVKHNHKIEDLPMDFKLKQF